MLPCLVTRLLKMSKRKENDTKTNAMRLLDALHVSYRYDAYDCREFVDALHTAARLGLPRG